MRLPFRWFMLRHRELPLSPTCLYFPLPSPLSRSPLPSSLPSAPPQLYTHDALYRHLACIGDCHCHLLIITVTCTLRSAINTWRYQRRAAAPQRLFRPPESWWERERRERETHKGFVAGMMCLFTNLTDSR